MAEGSITFEQARDLIATRFFEQFNGDMAGILDASSEDYPVIFWDNVDAGAEPPKDRPWFRVNIKHADSDQSSLGGIGGRRFTRLGAVTVQLFVVSGARGLALADRLGKMAVDAFEGKDAGGVWFRRVRLIEVGPDGPWFQYNVTADFTYDQTK